MPWRCTRWATRSAAPTRRRSRRSSTRCGIGSPRGSGAAPASRLALHRWRRYGRSSTAPRGRSRCSISTGNRWFSPSSGFSPKRRADRGLFHAASVPDMASKPYYITTAIPYANGPPHIGHAYEAIATDAIARFMRLDGYDVFFLTGTDEHGLKMQQSAAREGLSVRELSDRNVRRFQEMVERLDCSNDQFIRTTEARHYRASSAIWERMAKAGDIYLSKYTGWYSIRDEAYYGEAEIGVGSGGERRGPTGSPVEWVEEESYFFRLSAYQEKLLNLYRQH